MVVTAHLEGDLGFGAQWAAMVCAPWGTAEAEANALPSKSRQSGPGIHSTPKASFYRRAGAILQRNRIVLHKIATTIYWAGAADFGELACVEGGSLGMSNASYVSSPDATPSRASARSSTPGIDLAMLTSAVRESPTADLNHARTLGALIWSDSGAEPFKRRSKAFTFMPCHYPAESR